MRAVTLCSGIVDEWVIHMHAQYNHGQIFITGTHITIIVLGLNQTIRCIGEVLITLFYRRRPNEFDVAFPLVQ